MAIYQDLVGDHGFAAKYASVRRFVVRLRGRKTAGGAGRDPHEPGQEAQVDYGEGPMVRDSGSGKYRRTRLFVFTLGYSRKSVRLILWKSSSRARAELHERAVRRLGGAPRVIVLDNLREGVLKLDVYGRCPVPTPMGRATFRHRSGIRAELQPSVFETVWFRSGERERHNRASGSFPYLVGASPAPAGCEAPTLWLFQRHHPGSAAAGSSAERSAARGHPRSLPWPRADVASSRRPWRQRMTRKETWKWCCPWGGFNARRALRAPQILT
jgi:hypothetical protein